MRSKRRLEKLPKFAYNEKLSGIKKGSFDSKDPNTVLEELGLVTKSVKNSENSIGLDKTKPNAGGGKKLELSKINEEDEPS